MRVRTPSSFRKLSALKKTDQHVYKLKVPPNATIYPPYIEGAFFQAKGPLFQAFWHFSQAQGTFSSKNALFPLQEKRQNRG